MKDDIFVSVREVLPGEIALTGTVWGEEECRTLSDGKKAVHFSHHGVDVGITKEGQSAENRPEIARDWLKVWREACVVNRAKHTEGETQASQLADLTTEDSRTGEQPEVEDPAEGVLESSHQEEDTASQMSLEETMETVENDEDNQNEEAETEEDTTEEPMSGRNEPSELSQTQNSGDTTESNNDETAGTGDGISDVRESNNESKQLEAGETEPKLSVESENSGSDTATESTKKRRWRIFRTKKKIARHLGETHHIPNRLGRYLDRDGFERQDLSPGKFVRHLHEEERVKYIMSAKQVGRYSDGN